MHIISVYRQIKMVQEFKISPINRNYKYNRNAFYKRI